jgi:6-phosphofructokinase 1
MKRIGIVTRDCAGVNAAIRAVVRTAAARHVEVLGVLRGYQGLIEDDVQPLTRRSVSSIINLGGTILKSARAEQFNSEEGWRLSRETLSRRGIEGLIVIGGNGSLTGAHRIASKHGFPVVGVPTTIDNDVNGVELCLGADTAANVALEAIDKIRDTATSLERIFVVEVMGRESGWIAMQVALAGGCEEVLLPEHAFDMSAMCREIRAGNEQGKASWIIIVAEGAARAQDVAAAVTLTTSLETRIAVLGHIQRGGRPTAVDRILASRMGHAAVEALLEGATDILIHVRQGRIERLALEEAVKPKVSDLSTDYRLLKILR